MDSAAAAPSGLRFDCFIYNDDKTTENIQGLALLRRYFVCGRMGRERPALEIRGLSVREAISHNSPIAALDRQKWSRQWHEPETG